VLHTFLAHSIIGTYAIQHSPEASKNFGVSVKLLHSNLCPANIDSKCVSVGGEVEACHRLIATPAAIHNLANSSRDVLTAIDVSCHVVARYVIEVRYTNHVVVRYVFAPLVLPMITAFPRRQSSTPLGLASHCSLPRLASS
jgi:hypothetical protein